MLSTQEVQAKYQRHAKVYDFYLTFYRLLGLRHNLYRSRAVEQLHLKQGDVVIDLGCGTGLSFSLMINKIGAEGRLIGIDLTPGMLSCARERVKRYGWKNIDLVQSDVATYDFPEGINGVLSIGTLGYVPEYEQVIEKVSHTLVPGGRLVILDGKRSERIPIWFFKIFLLISRPFGVTSDYFDKHPCWKSVERLFTDVEFEEIYGGLMYMSSGTVPSSKS